MGNSFIYETQKRINFTKKGRLLWIWRGPRLRAQKQTKKRMTRAKLLGEDGAGNKSRTRDLMITNQLLYQLSYTGKVGILQY